MDAADRGAGAEHGDVQQVLLAGSFGSYLSPASAVRIGLVPKLPVLRIVSAGNVAGEGAKMCLLSKQERGGATTLLEEVRYVELSDRSDFNDRFVDLLAFPGLRRSPSPTVCRRQTAGLALRRPHDRLRSPRPAVGGDRRAQGWPVDVFRCRRCSTTSPEDRRARSRRWRSRWPLRVGGGRVRRLRDVRRPRRGSATAGWRRLPGLHCYDVYAGQRRVESMFDDQPGTYVLTDFLVRSFARTVARELGLDR